MFIVMEGLVNETEVGASEVEGLPDKKFVSLSQNWSFVKVGWNLWGFITIVVSVELAALVMGGSVDMGRYVVIDDKGGEG